MSDSHLPIPINLARPEEQSVDEIAAFFLGLAGEETWALELVEVELGQDPFEYVAVVWVGLGAAARSEVGRGLLRAVALMERGHRPGNSHKATGLNLLAFLSFVVRDLDAHQRDEAVHIFGDWVLSGLKPQREFAAVGLSQTRSLEAIRYLEKAAEKEGYQPWITRCLIPARAGIDRFGFLRESANWLADSISDKTVVGILQRHLTQILSEDIQQATSYLTRVADNSNRSISAQLGEILAEIDSAGLPGVSSLVSYLMAGEDGVRHGVLFTQLVPQIDGIMEVAEGVPLSSMELRAIVEGLAVIVRSPEAGTESTAEDIWAQLYCATTRLPSRPHSDAAFRMIREAAFIAAASPDKIRRLQRTYYDHKLQQAGRWDDVERKFLFALKGRASPARLKESELPRTIRIPTTGYAEDVYIQIFAQLIRSNYESVNVVRVGGIEWDKIDDAFKSHSIDIGLNNSDLLSYTTSPDGLNILQLSGTPLYTFSKLHILARADFLEKQGVLDQFPTNLFGNEAEIAPGLFAPVGATLETLSKAVAGGTASVARDTALVEIFEDFLTKIRSDTAGGHRVEITQSSSDIGVTEFLRGDAQIFVGGNIHAEYLLNNWSGVRCIGQIFTNIEGRLFASADFYDEYPRFMAQIPHFLDKTRLIWNNINRASDERVLYHDYIMHHINKTMFDFSTHNIVTFEEFASIERALSTSKLCVPSGRRAWEPFDPASGRGDHKVVPMLRATTKGNAYE